MPPEKKIKKKKKKKNEKKKKHTYEMPEWKSVVHYKCVTKREMCKNIRLAKRQSSKVTENERKKKTKRRVQ